MAPFPAVGVSLNGGLFNLASSLTYPGRGAKVLHFGASSGFVRTKAALLLFLVVCGCGKWQTNREPSIELTKVPPANEGGPDTAGTIEGRVIGKRRSSLETAMSPGDDFGVDGLSYQIADHAPNPEKRYAQFEKEKILHKAVRSLRPRLRRTVEFQQLQERSMRETADAMCISVAAVKGRLFHAKNVLRKSLTVKLFHRPRTGNRLQVLSAA